MNTKSFLKGWIPPAILGVLPRRGQVVRFSGSFPDWKAALKDATGYDSEEILARVAASTRKVISGDASFERDSVVFNHVEYSWPLLACLLQVAAELGSLRVVDFGGSLGSTYRQNGAFLQRLKLPMRWRVVEQEAFVALGKAEFADGILGFDRTVAEAAAQGVDVVLFASSLCYVEDPEAILREVENSAASFLVVDRMPVTDGWDDRIAVQEVFEPIYRASYPVRIFGEQNLLRTVLKDWRVIESWDCQLVPDDSFRHRGYFLQRR